MNVDTFRRDPNSGAIINNDDSEYKKILAARANAKKTQETNRKIEMLERDIKEIRKMLQEAIGKNNG